MNNIQQALELLQRLKTAFIDHVTDPYPADLKLLREVDEFTDKHKDE